MSASKLLSTMTRATRKIEEVIPMLRQSQLSDGAVAKWNEVLRGAEEGYTMVRLEINERSGPK